MADKIFVDGLMNTKANETMHLTLLSAHISINRTQTSFRGSRARPDEWMNVQVLDSKNKPGKWYAEVDTWKPRSE